MSHEIPITAESVVSWSEAPVATEVDREVVLMNIGRGRCYGLGEAGSSVWRRLGPQEVTVPAGSTADVDTWEDVHRLDSY